MSTIGAYTCPSCGGSMLFVPEKQKFRCEYCTSLFTEEEIRAYEKTFEQKNVATNDGNTNAKKFAREQDTSTVDGEQNTASANSASTADARNASARKDASDQQQEHTVYQCPSCGAEVVAAGTQLVNTCFYCHSTMVQSGSDSSFHPDMIIPFAISKEKATEMFLKWARRHKFVPKGFFNKKQIAHLTGIYYPYWVADINASGSASFKATNTHVWCTADTETTETSIYSAERAGEFFFGEVTCNALKKADVKMVESVLPFDFAQKKDYLSAYLLGFQAERRDIEKSEAEENLGDDVTRWGVALLQNTVTGYSSVSVNNANIKVKDAKFLYGLFPVWMLSYIDRKGKHYNYALNGQTGKACGELPISFGRLAILFSTIFASVFALVCALEYFL